MGNMDHDERNRNEQKKNLKGYPFFFCYTAPKMGQCPRPTLFGPEPVIDAALTFMSFPCRRRNAKMTHCATGGDLAK
jgi:hypothetical protein